MTYGSNPTVPKPDIGTPRKALGTSRKALLRNYFGNFRALNVNPRKSPEGFCRTFMNKSEGTGLGFRGLGLKEP